MQGVIAALSSSATVNGLEGHLKIISDISVNILTKCTTCVHAKYAQLRLYSFIRTEKQMM